MEVDVSLYGNSYWTAPKGIGQLVRLDPTRVQIATADVVDAVTGNTIGKRLVGYTLNDQLGQLVAVFFANEVAHYRPIPDPAHEFRGISWMNALLPDIIADLDMSDYKHAFLKNGATPSLVVTFEKGTSREAAEKFRDRMESRHVGPEQAWKPLYLGAGADVKVVGSNFTNLNIDEVQSAGETRIASAAGVPPSLLSLSEGLKGSALNAGNYAATRRRFSDGTMRPLWRSACGALTTLVKLPANNRLWYDSRDVPFLQADITDQSQAQQLDSTTILSLINSGFEPDSVVIAVSTGDLTVLKHTGLVSVQLQAPGAAQIPDATPIPAPNDTGTNEN
jgi:phage portal protein BeeE